MPGAIVVKACGFFCTGSLSRLVRVSSLAERGRRAMVWAVSWKCPVHGDEVDGVATEKDRHISSACKDLRTSYEAGPSATERTKALQGHAVHSTISPAGTLR